MSTYHKKKKIIPVIKIFFIKKYKLISPPSFMEPLKFISLSAIQHFIQINFNLSLTCPPSFSNKYPVCFITNQYSPNVHFCLTNKQTTRKVVHNFVPCFSWYYSDLSNNGLLQFRNSLGIILIKIRLEETMVQRV